MSAYDKWGASTGNIHQGNPFNVPDIVYLDNTGTPPTITGASVTSATTGGLGDPLSVSFSATDDQGMRHLNLFFSRPGGSVFNFSCSYN